MSSDPLHADDPPELPEVGAPADVRAPAAPGGQPPLRVLDKAPRRLRLAALIVMAGSVLPWMPGLAEDPPGPSWLTTLLAKGIMGAAAWLWMQQALHDFGPKSQGAIGQLASLRLKPAKRSEGGDNSENGGKQRRARPKASAPTHLEPPFPTGLHVLALLLVVAALSVGARDPRLGFAGMSSGIPEVAMLGWAAFTWVHIAGYRRWSGFNPLFPLMFPGLLVAGAAAVLGGLTSGADGLTRLMGVVGGATVASGGGLATYTIAEAMMQAKREGDRKKAESLELRKSARQRKA